MATRTVAAAGEGADAVPREPSFVLPFTWVSVALGGLLVGGVFLDGWAHHHGRLDISLLGATNLSQAYAPPGLPATISSWHVPYVAGIVLSAVLLGAVLVANRTRGIPWARALPAPYWMSVWGVLMIVLGAVGEVIWPVSFRIGAPDTYRLELGSSGLGAVLSPLRLMELVGLVLIVTGPLRAAWLGAEEEPRRRFAPLPAVLSLAFLLSLLAYATQFAHPLVEPWPALSYWRRSLHTYRYGTFLFGESLGVMSILLQTALMMAIILPAVRRWRLRPGGLTLLFTLNAALMAILQDYYAFALVGLAAGIAAELLLQRLPQSPRPREFQLFAFLVPAVYYLIYFVALTRMANISPSWGTLTRVVLPHPLEGIAWNVQLWTGTALAAGLVGWAVSLLVLPAGPARSPSARSG